MLTLAGALLAGCRSGGAPPTTITLYNGQHPQTTASLVAAFEQQTGIHVQVRNGDEDLLAQQIATEGPSSPADVFISENSPALQFLAAKRLLAPVAASTLAAVPARFDSPAGDWVGVTARVSGIVYNTGLLSKAALPPTVMDLAKGAWAGRIGIAPSETDFQPVVTSVERSYGHAAALSWLEALKHNAGSHLYPDNESLTAAVNSGQVALAVVNDYYWYRLAYEEGPSKMHSAFAFFAPHDAGYVLDVSGAAVLASSRHKAAAQRFLAFLVSPEAQRLIASSASYEYPLLAGVAARRPLPPLTSLQPAPLSVQQLGDGSQALALLHEAQLL